MSESASMSATVVIPTHNRFSSLSLVLEALSSQSIAPSSFNVIVVIDGTQDRSYDKLREHTYPFPLETIWQESAGAGSARNRGAKEATSDILVFLDDDVIPTQDWLTEHLKAHQLYDKNSVFIGPMWSPTEYTLQPWVAWEQEQLADKYSRMLSGELEPNPHQFYTGNVSLRREHFMAVGGFDPEIQRAEDLELAYRLANYGLRFCFLPRAGGEHYAQRSYDSWLNIAYQYGRNTLFFAKEKGHPLVLDVVLAGYNNHHPLVKTLVHLCLDRAMITRFLTTLLAQIALISSRFDGKSVANMVFSAIFNLRRYQGLSDALGGRKLFFHAVAKPTYK